MATNNTTTTATATEAALIATFEAQARADGFIDEPGFFVGPDGLDVDQADIERPVVAHLMP